jgi:hypothetical protein
MQMVANKMIHIDVRDLLLMLLGLYGILFGRYAKCMEMNGGKTMNNHVRFVLAIDNFQGEGAHIIRTPHFY